MEEIPWLREMVDEDLQILFSEDEDEVSRGVRGLIARAQAEEDLEDQLVELLETSLEHQNDDSSASVWATVILGEIRSVRALAVLRRSLASDEDEMLQDAAQVALLRIGAPAIETVMEAIEEDGGLMLRRAAYGLLGMVGVLEDDALRQRVGDFLETRVEPERQNPLAERAVEELFQAAAHLGLRKQLELMKEVLEKDYHGHNVPVQDAIERLEENVDRVAFVGTRAPWEERYEWLLRDERQEARISRSPSGKITLELGNDADGAEASDEKEQGSSEKQEARQDQVSRLMRGLSMVDPGNEEADGED